jgi:hypothetical protein
MGIWSAGPKCVCITRHDCVSTLIIFHAGPGVGLRLAPINLQIYLVVTEIFIISSWSLLGESPQFFMAQ